MPSFRIYALAKEMGLEPKQIVEVCPKVGISGKGSALSSLSKEEVDKVKAYLAGEVEADRPKAKNAQPSISAVTTPSNSPTDVGVVRREDYIPPGGAAEKLPVLEDASKKKDTADSSKVTVKPALRSAPSIKLAPLPATKNQQTEPVSDEPVPQKPDLRLPPDALRASQPGSKPLAQHLRRHEKPRPSPAGKSLEPGRPVTKKGLPPAKVPPSAAPSELRGKGRRVKGTKGEQANPEDKPLLGGREQRQLSRRRTTTRRHRDEDEEGRPRRRARHTKRTSINTAAPRKDKVVVQLPCSVRTFSEITGVPAPDILRILLSEGAVASLNMDLDAELTEFLAEKLDSEVEIRQPVRLEDRFLNPLHDQEDHPETLVTRPPVITFLGHVDHGKTSLLDRIIGIDVVSGEHGGITQHIRAYKIEKDGRDISFVDTPGHEAFTEMRARGANVTDLVVLVIAADDGVMPQTEEAISHGQAAGVPMVVALNKIDLPGIDIQHLYQQLSVKELLPSEWGGDVEVVKTSATTGEGVDELLETLLTVAELHDYKANPNRPAQGTCLEAQQEGGRGVIAKVIVQAGTLRVGDPIVCGQAYGRVKAMYDTLSPNKTVVKAGPSVPVNMTGLNIAPEAGEPFYVLQDIARARQIAESRADENRRETLGGTAQHVTLENLFERLDGTDKTPTLNIVLRADVRGSIEAIEKEFTKLEHPEVGIKILQATVGGITEADVHLAHASDAVIIGFNVVPDEGARQLADQHGVQIRRYNVIYKVTDDLKAALEGMLKPDEREVELGRALVQATFSISRIGTIAGCRTLAGTIHRNSRVRVIRNNTIIGDYLLDTLKREKDAVREVREGMECGIKLDGFNDFKEADLLEVYRIEEVSRKFDAS